MKTNRHPMQNIRHSLAALVLGAAITLPLSAAGPPEAGAPKGADAKGIVSRDLFIFNSDPAGGDGTFSATGVVPRIANELAARGMKLDAGMFKRATR